MFSYNDFIENSIAQFVDLVDFGEFVVKISPVWYSLKYGSKGYATRKRFFKANLTKSTKSMKNPIVQWSFQQNRYSPTCTAKSPFAVNREFNYGSDSYSGVYY